MEKFSTKQQTTIIELYFENHHSITLTQKAYHRHYNVRQTPNQSTIDCLVKRFRQQVSVSDLAQTSTNFHTKFKWYRHCNTQIAVLLSLCCSHSAILFHTDAISSKFFEVTFWTSQSEWLHL